MLLVFLKCWVALGPVSISACKARVDPFLQRGWGRWGGRSMRCTHGPSSGTRIPVLLGRCQSPQATALLLRSTRPHLALVWCGHLHTQTGGRGVPHRDAATSVPFLSPSKSKGCGTLYVPLFGGFPLQCDPTCLLPFGDSS